MVGLVQRTSLVDEAAEQLRAAVTGGTWPVGSRIPTEPELVRSFGVSRATVREAVRGLVHAGLLETRQGDGTYVVADDPTQVALTRRLGAAAARDVLEVRRGLDIVAAELAASRRTRRELAAIEAAYDAR